MIKKLFLLVYYISWPNYVPERKKNSKKKNICKTSKQSNKNLQLPNNLNAQRAPPPKILNYVQPKQLTHSPMVNIFFAFKYFFFHLIQYYISDDKTNPKFLENFKAVHVFFAQQMPCGTILFFRINDLIQNAINLNMIFLQSHVIVSFFQFV